MGGGGSQGNTFDVEYNRNMSTLANLTAGMGYNDYLRRYGYQLNPAYGGITNPMASYKIATTGRPGALGGNFTLDSTGAPAGRGSFTVGGQSALDQGYNAAPSAALPWASGQQEYGGSTLFNNARVDNQGLVVPQGFANTGEAGLQGNFIGQGIGFPGGAIGAGGGGVNPATGQPYFVKATDMYGNPIISAIDIEDQANRLNYALAPRQAETIGNVYDTVNRRLLANTPEAIKQRQAQAMGEASANTWQAFNPSALRAELGRAGVKGQSGQFTDAMAKLAFERSKALAGNRYAARRGIEEQARAEDLGIIQAAASALPQAS